MNQQLSAAELAAIAKAHPVVETPPPIPKLTKREKLLALAELVGKQRYSQLFSNLENWRSDHLAEPSYLTHPGYSYTAVALAARHEPFLADGLKPVGVGSVVNYLELTREELHQFSCDCGGAIDPEEAASRLRRLAG